MLWAYLGAALFLAGALPLTARDVVPGHHRDVAALADAPAVTIPDAMTDAPLAPRDELMQPEFMSTTRLRAVVVLTSVLAAVAGAVVLERWWVADAAYAAGAVVTLPVLVALAVIDIDVHRLPNRLTGTLALLTAAALLVAAATRSTTLSDEAPLAPLAASTPGDDLRRALVGAVVLGAAYLVLALLGGGQGMGLGDVKLAPSLGAMTAWAGWSVWVSAAVFPFVLGGVWGGVLLVRGRGRHARMPFGPFMIAGTFLALCTS